VGSYGTLLERSMGKARKPRVPQLNMPRHLPQQAPK
jgi:hypothetical protein